jgi:hypothetical protein
MVLSNKTADPGENRVNILLIVLCMRPIYFFSKKIRQQNVISWIHLLES